MTLATFPAPISVPMRARTKWRQIAIYYAIACGVSWTIWAPLVLGRDGLDLLHIAPPPPVIISTGTLGPLLACYLTHRLGTGNWRAVQFLPRHRFRGLWLLLAPMLILVCFFVVFPALISKGPPSAWRWHLSVLGGILVPMFNYNLLGGPLFEEFGWRGFLQSRLQDVLPPWIAAICVGVMWAAWHLPLFLVQGWSSASPVAYPVILIGLSMVMAFGFNASEEAIGAAILMHSAFNSSPRFVGAYLNGGSMREHPTAVWLIAASFLLAGIMLVIITRGRLAASQTTDR
jgi:membrane protease YdiL (CAAX protease family)